jgi:hypothetical protein
MADPLKSLQHQQHIIFWLEFAGLLHDIGKLQNAFIKYRQNWQTTGEADPHESDFLGNGKGSDIKLKDVRFRDLHELFMRPFSRFCGTNEIASSNGTTLSMNQSIAELVKLHSNPGPMEIAQMLHAADGKDSAEDRNNPLLVNEQHGATVYKSTVFGYETPIADDLEEVRTSLYHDLQGCLCPSSPSIGAELREKVHGAVYTAFRQGVTDTCRPANDIVLWEHAYATAALFKALIAHFILYGEKLLSFDDVFFALWGVGWDGMRYYSKGHKIADIVGRKALIGELKKGTRRIVEWDYSLGNAIYDDDNGVYFIIPQLKDGKSGWFDTLRRNSAIP